VTVRYNTCVVCVGCFEGMRVAVRVYTYVGVLEVGGLRAAVSVCTVHICVCVFYVLREREVECSG